MVRIKIYLKWGSVLLGHRPALHSTGQPKLPDAPLRESGIISHSSSAQTPGELRIFAFLWSNSSPWFMILLNSFFFRALCDRGYLRLNHLAWNCFLLPLERVYKLDRCLLWWFSSVLSEFSLGLLVSLLVLMLLSPVPTPKLPHPRKKPSETVEPQRRTSCFFSLHMISW